MNREERLLSSYAYCLCLSVKSGTIFIGFINLIGSLLCGIMFMASFGYHPANDIDYGRPGFNASHRTTTTSLAVIMYMMCATVSAMLIYGVIKSRPSYLMPFFGIQLFDFFFSLPTFLSSLYSSPAHYGSHWDGGEGNHRLLDVKKLLPNATPVTVYTSSLLFTTCFMLFKGYFLCVVWKCYRYLKMKEMILPLNLPFHQPGVEVVIPQGFLGPPPTSMLAPPDYETATKLNAPPDYESAIKNDQEFKYPELVIPASQTPPVTVTQASHSSAPVTLASSLNITQSSQAMPPVMVSPSESIQAPLSNTSGNGPLQTTTPSKETGQMTNEKN